MLRAFHVARDDLRRWRWQEGEPPAGGMLVAIEKFAFSANNVTYARLGERLDYWGFFPAPRGWGAIPVWGLGRGVADHDGIRGGERVYGYFPMASHLVLQPGALKGVRFADQSAHRAALPKTYNDYGLVDRDRGYDRAHEDEHLVLRPLFSLSFCCAAFLEDEQCFGARRVLVSSASSKAALGLAHLLAPLGAERVGLTSRGNLEFVKARGVFERVLAYDEVASLSPEVATVFVDLAGSAQLVAAVHQHLREALAHSALAGFTHGTAMAAGAALPGPGPKLFFTPAHIVRRIEQWGADGYRARFAAAWRGFLGFVAPWLAITHTSGRAGLERVYREALEGRTRPETAHVLSLA